MTVAQSNGTSETTADTQKRVDPDKIRDRSRSSGFDLLKWVLGLATASVGVFFTSLLKGFDPPLTGMERPALIAAILFMAAAVVAGMGAWAADALFYKRWADVLREKKGASWEARETAKSFRGYFLVLLGSLFLFGVLAAAAFTLHRVA